MNGQNKVAGCADQPMADAVLPLKSLRIASCKKDAIFHENGQKSGKNLNIKGLSKFGRILTFLSNKDDVAKLHFGKKRCTEIIGDSPFLKEFGAYLHHVGSGQGRGEGNHQGCPSDRGSKMAWVEIEILSG
ncbi:MAG: hypothetical protein JEZ11_12345 [Desulfobacterales bacterium]|nr:hypothetical protein [Desulfobacterales bacterium]